MANPIRLGVNVDHVATLRQVRGTLYPDPVEIARAAERAGAGGITAHLREDRRHIQEDDVRRLRSSIATKLNLELAVADDVVAFACSVRPEDCCLVPERREELTTEGGLAVAGNEARIGSTVERLAAAGITVSLFIDPDAREVDAARAVGAPTIELHTGRYADAASTSARASELDRIRRAASHACSAGLTVNAGHGLTVANVGPIAEIEEIVELNIGHSIVARALFLGIEGAVSEMLAACSRARR